VNAPGEQPPTGRSPWALLGLGTELAATLGVGVLLGYWLDRWLGTEPWFLFGGALLGMATALIHFFLSAIPPKETS
jgi:ATP synthase protein I